MDRNARYIFFGLIVFLSFLGTSRFVRASTITQLGTVSVGAIVGGLPIIDTGGSGGGTSTAKSGVRFSGFAYPGATVVVQKALTNIASTTANSKGAFSIVISENSGQLFTLFVTDVDGRTSGLLNFPTALYMGYITEINGIRFAPTIATDKLAVKKGDYLTIAGAAVPRVPLEISIQGLENMTLSLVADDTGHYSITVPIAIAWGEYTLTSRYVDDERASAVVRLVVGANTIYQNEATANVRGDFNFDQKVTIVDFSILAYWFGKENPPITVDLNKDGAITLVDFSIMAFYWTG